MEKSMPKILLFLVLACLTGTTASAADNKEPATEAQIIAVISELTEAWRLGDGNAWADAFVEDADFTVWFGLSLKGREQIAWGHQLIFDSFYKDTVFDLAVRQVRFLGEDVAIAHLEGAIIEDGQESPAEPDAVPIVILHRADDDWKIVAFQNTPFVVNEFRTNGDLKRFKRLAADQSNMQ